MGFDGHLKNPLERKYFIATITQHHGQHLVELETQGSLGEVDRSELVIEFTLALESDKKDIILHVKNNNLAKLAQTAHRLGGAVPMFGFAALAERAIKLSGVLNPANITVSLNLAAACYSTFAGRHRPNCC